MFTTLADRAVRRVRSWRYGEPIVVVSGLPRSGTSLVMQMLQAGGIPIFTDHVRAADGDNPRGYLEYEPVKHLATTTDRRWLRDARGQALKVVSYFLRYLPPEHNYDILFVERDLGEIVASQDRMLSRRGADVATEPPATRRLLETHLSEVRREMRRNRAFRVLDVSHRSLITSAGDEAIRIQTFLERDLDLVAMARIVDPALHRNRSVQEARTSIQNQNSDFETGTQNSDVSSDRDSAF